MKNYSILTVSIFMALCIFMSCNNNNSKNDVIVPEGMHVYSLTAYGKPFSIFVPDTLKTKLEITEQSNGALEISAGSNFGISIYEQSADLELLMSDLKDDEVNKLKSFIVQEPNMLLWESEIAEQPQFHFVINKTINNTEYSFEDLKNTENDPYSKTAIQKMFDICKNTEGNQK
jgi:hypothetical protein